MKRTLLMNVIFSAVVFGVVPQQANFRVLEGIAEAQSVIEIAYKAGGKEKSLYHFEKARAYRDLSVLFASEMEEISAKVFTIKSMNSASKSIEGVAEPDELPEPQLPQSQKNKEKKPSVELKDLFADLRKIREEKAFECAPKELAFAEAYYESLAYELSKDNPKGSLIKPLYNGFLSNYLLAKEKVQLAKRESLVCYTGRLDVPIAVKEEPQETIVQRQEEPKQEVKQEPAEGEEPLFVRARVHFDLNKADIKKEYVPLLKEVAKVLKENPNINLRIEGYTDNIGTKAHNQKLALRRATAVKNFLVKEGIKPERIQVVGFGKEGYIADNTTPIGKLTNRRVEFIVIQVPTE